MRRLRIAVVGATGLVGEKVLRILEERETPVERLVPLATEGLGRTVTFQGESWPVQALPEMQWDGIDVAFFAAGNAASERYAPVATASGVTVIDKSSRFRMDPKVPLVVPEVNAGAIGDALLIASPNCSTIQLVVALDPIRRAVGLDRVIVSTYQAVSGTGRDAMTALDQESRAMLAGEAPTPTAYPTPIAFNVLPYCDAFLDADYTGEEWKLTRESEKIFGESVRLSATAVRVPVQVGHAESVYVETERPISVDEVRGLLQSAPGVRLVDDPSHGVVPVPLDAAGQDAVLVGRIRKDPYADQGLHLFVVADNLRKGAATNAVQIMEQVAHRFAE